MGENCDKTSNFGGIMGEICDEVPIMWKLCEEITLKCGNCGGIMEILCDFAQKTDELWENCVKIVGLCEKCVNRRSTRHVRS